MQQKGSKGLLEFKGEKISDDKDTERFLLIEYTKNLGLEINGNADF
jgi:hypothetical protein